MDPSYGITSKLLVWFCMIAAIFYGTILVLYINVQKAVGISETIVARNYTISSSSKKMIESLLSMEENEKKYGLLQKKDYLDYFVDAQQSFEKNLIEILELEPKGIRISGLWHQLYQEYGNYPSAGELASFKEAGKPHPSAADGIWIPENIINQWIDLITKAQLENRLDVEKLTRELSQRGKAAARNGLIGLGISSLVGILRIAFLAYSMIRPLRELIKGIRSISKNLDSRPIQIRSKDEFGELASAFNEMTSRLREEERMRSDFISMLSHEIRTPLTSIRESVNMIGEEVMGPINQRQRKFLHIASSEIGRICDLLNHLMQASRLAPGTLKFQPQPIDPYILVTGCVESLKPAVTNKEIQIETQFEEGLGQVMGDPQQLQQVLLNLLGNAIKFSESESRILVRVEADVDDKVLRFSVEDDGPGIHEEELGLLFNKYYRSQTAREHLDGVGLGLSIAKNIVEAHNGNIWVESRYGEGSIFGFTIPKAPKNHERGTLPFSEKAMAG